MATLGCLTSRAAPALHHFRPHRLPPMPPLTLPFPNIDPVLFSIGPFSVRWYALACIAGILGGWLYARTITRSQKVWGGPAPLTVADYDDFILWVTLGIIFGGRLGYILFYNAGHYVAHPLDVFKLWNGGMSFHGGFLGCVLAGGLFGPPPPLPWLSAGDLTRPGAPVWAFPARAPPLRHR